MFPATNAWHSCAYCPRKAPVGPAALLTVRRREALARASWSQTDLPWWHHKGVRCCLTRRADAPEGAKSTPQDVSLFWASLNSFHSSSLAFPGAFEGTTALWCFSYCAILYYFVWLLPTAHHLNEDFKWYWPQSWPWVTILLTGIQMEIVLLIAILWPWISYWMNLFHLKKALSATVGMIILHMNKCLAVTEGCLLCLHLQLFFFAINKQNLCY